MSPAPTTPQAPAETDPVTVRAAALLKKHLPGAVVAVEETGKHPWIRVKAESIHAACVLLRDDPTTRLDCCHLISGVDWPAKKPGDVAELEVVYHLVSYSLPFDPAYRARAQALYTLMLSGVGNTLGYLSCGWWSRATSADLPLYWSGLSGNPTVYNVPNAVKHWPEFWAGLSISVAAIWIWFALSYRGRAAESPRPAIASELSPQVSETTRSER